MAYPHQDTVITLLGQQDRRNRIKHRFRAWSRLVNGEGIKEWLFASIWRMVIAIGMWLLLIHRLVSLFYIKMGG